jgi:hypothetical protein
MPEYFEANVYLGELIEEGGKRGVIVFSPFPNLVEYLYWAFLSCDGAMLGIDTSKSELKITGIGAENNALRVTVAVPVDAEMVSGIDFSELQWVGFVAAVDDESGAVAMPPVPVLGVEVPS